MKLCRAISLIPVFCHMNRVQLFVLPCKGTTTRWYFQWSILIPNFELVNVLISHFSVPITGRKTFMSIVNDPPGSCVSIQHKKLRIINYVLGWIFMNRVGWQSLIKSPEVHLSLLPTWSHSMKALSVNQKWSSHQAQNVFWSEINQFPNIW